MHKIRNLELIVANQIKLDSVQIFAQPIVSLQNNSNTKRSHFEILSRFKDSLGNLIMPEEFFSRNRNVKELLSLDKIIFEHSFKILHSISSKLGNNYLAAINISEATIINEKFFLNFIEKLRKKYLINSQNIQLEITEKTNKCVFQFVKKALDLGYGISVDDFWSENSTIRTLTDEVLKRKTKEELSRIKVKIDKRFILNLVKQNNSNYFTDRGMINLALSIQKDFPQITLVAEGVKNLKTALYLKNFGIDFAQGFYFLKPTKLDSTYTQPHFNF